MQYWRGRRPCVNHSPRRLRVSGSGVVGLVLVLVATVSLIGASPAAAQTSGEVLAWGSNDVGQLGTGTSIAFSSVPVQSPLPAGATATAVAPAGRTALF
ncbi:RCC1-like domain-containing protein [Actinopolymorpha pittospori]|uniref:Uncharacterized protein n=1 Tax=Actinopolymorpha pittospori TaxID=648752 RepID=A0A927MYH4_9ACTN|nr:RCC1 domain-containing protein [Actinopolymorpha pittospori]MBE1605500.1 hypothetical protein [Actinopolymorpha pittospori]